LLRFQPWRRTRCGGRRFGGEPSRSFDVKSMGATRPQTPRGGTHQRGRARTLARSLDLPASDERAMLNDSMARPPLCWNCGRWNVGDLNGNNRDRPRFKWGADPGYWRLRLNGGKPAATHISPSTIRTRAISEIEGVGSSSEPHPMSIATPARRQPKRSRLIRGSIIPSGQK